MQFSLRSENRRVDVSGVATHFGGGGHRNAAGFTIAAADWASGMAIDGGVALDLARRAWAGIERLDGYGYDAETACVWLRLDQQRDAAGRCVNIVRYALDDYVAAVARVRSVEPQPFVPAGFVSPRM